MKKGFLDWLRNQSKKTSALPSGEFCLPVTTDHRCQVLSFNDSYRLANRKQIFNV